MKNKSILLTEIQLHKHLNSKKNNYNFATILRSKNTLLSEINLNYNTMTNTNTPDFKYSPMIQIGKDETEYYLLSKEGVSIGAVSKNIK